MNTLVKEILQCIIHKAVARYAAFAVKACTGDANAKMHAIAKRLQAKESSSLWTRLVGKIGVHKTKE